MCQLWSDQAQAKLALFFIEESLLDDPCAPICLEMANIAEQLSKDSLSFTPEP